MLSEFKAFAFKGNVVDLAVAVIIGGAFGKIVSAFISDIVMPVIGMLMPAGDWRSWKVTQANIMLGDFIGVVVDFFIIALVIFIVIVKFMGAMKKKEEAPAPSEKACPHCLSNVPLKATKCKFCASALAA
jgi:large conductance mechanosensitive channel